MPSVCDVKECPDFEPNKQYGDYVCVTDWENETLEFARKMLVKQIRSFIPTKYCNKKNIKFIYSKIGNSGTADPLNQIGYVVGWKYSNA